MWIQTGVTVRKRLNVVMTSLTFDLWPWPFAWTSLLSLVISLENFMMIWWWEHSQKGVTDRQTDVPTDGKYHSLSCLVAAKNNRAPLLCHFKLCVAFRSHWWIQTGVKSPETPNLGQIWRFLEPCDLEIWRMTLKNNRAPLLSIIKLYASFHHHMWIQTRVTVWKRLSWVLTSVTLTFDLWPWPFAWTSLLSLVITPQKFHVDTMMGTWWKRCDGWTDGRTDRRTEPVI